MFVSEGVAQGEPVGPPKPVVVVNTPNDPVQVRLTGTSQPLPVTGIVGITTNQPLPVTGTVGITTNQPVPVTGTVGITTTENAPLLVRDIHNPARQPFHRSVFLPATTFSVPAGKRLFIEFASMNMSVSTGCQVITLTVQTSVGGDTAFFSLPPTHVPNPAGSGRNFDTVGQQVRIYADPGTQVSFLLFTQATGACNPLGTFSVSGYLVDVP
ncbi:MAG TPA: hypothetical protein VNA17_03210 [Pyrinomonadaceae bacterium]|nr:hypothetical protein [Pyrinomonadaceae bacterium]